MNFVKIAACWILSAFILALAGCSTSGSLQVLNPEYQNRAKAFDSSVTIFPLTEDIVEPSVWQKHLEYDKESRSLVNFNNRQTFEKYFALSFSETTTGDVHNVMGEESLEIPANITFKDSTLSLADKEQMTVLIPEKGKLIAGGVETDYSLLIQSINWQLVQIEEQSKPVGGYNELFIELDIKFKYVIWDNQQERVAAYGYIRESEILSGRPGRITYIQIFEKISRDIVQKSPLQERYVQEY